eukprot:TRINITY_DN16652_c0_g1_i1.p1 TRINITY_DN16652_c0_g1~~TRINITY_DN16652_c0_g1_i1.p1  ORF type:complete len:162 (-),score=67.51 TRINITY_DN16652_c0_g1_i1:96-581(-)
MPRPNLDPDWTPNPRVTVVDECGYDLVVESPLACPLCTNQSYTYGLGPCKANHRQTRTWMLREGVQCFGGVTRADEELPCERVVAVQLGLNPFTLGVLAIGAVFLGLLLSLLYMAYQNHRMYEQYKRLSQTAGHDLEEEDMDEIPNARELTEDHNDDLNSP